MHRPDPYPCRLLGFSTCTAPTLFDHQALLDNTTLPEVACTCRANIDSDVNNWRISASTWTSKTECGGGAAATSRREDDDRSRGHRATCIARLDGERVPRNVVTAGCNTVALTISHCPAALPVQYV